MKRSESCSKGLDLVRVVEDSFLEVATWLGLRDGWIHRTKKEEEHSRRRQHVFSRREHGNTRDDGKSV